MTGYKKIFFDTAPLVYYLEKNEKYFEKMVTFIRENANIAFCTSSITVTEYSVIPYRLDKPELINAFHGYLEASKTDIINIDEAIADKAAQIRATYKSFRTMDALQLAAAISSGCDIFLSNDAQLKRFDEIKCLMVEDI